MVGDTKYLQALLPAKKNTPPHDKHASDLEHYVKREKTRQLADEGVDRRGQSSAVCAAPDNELASEDAFYLRRGNATIGHRVISR